MGGAARRRLHAARPGGLSGGLLGVIIAIAVAVLVPQLGGGGFDVSTAGLDGLPRAGGAEAPLPPEADPDRGVADAAMGPFSCPADQQVYVDLAFFDELSTRFGAAGDFAQADVIAHEVGHHVQDELGISDQVHRLEQESPDDVNGPAGLSTRQELQADCLAGVWAHSKQGEGVLEGGDVDEALRAAAGVGDDAIQSQATGRVHPEAFTHDSSEQRTRWFRTGLRGGRAEECDTFSVDEP